MSGASGALRRCGGFSAPDAPAVLALTRTARRSIRHFPDLTSICATSRMRCHEIAEAEPTCQPGLRRDPRRTLPRDTRPRRVLQGDELRDPFQESTPQNPGQHGENHSRGSTPPSPAAGIDERRAARTGRHPPASPACRQPGPDRPEWPAAAGRHQPWDHPRQPVPDDGAVATPPDVAFECRRTCWSVTQRRRSVTPAAVEARPSSHPLLEQFQAPRGRPERAGNLRTGSRDSAGEPVKQLRSGGCRQAVPPARPGPAVTGDTARRTPIDNR